MGIAKPASSAMRCQLMLSRVPVPPAHAANCRLRCSGPLWTSAPGASPRSLSGVHCCAATQTGDLGCGCRCCTGDRVGLGVPTCFGPPESDEAWLELCSAPASSLVPPTPGLTHSLPPRAPAPLTGSASGPALTLRAAAFWADFVSSTRAVVVVFLFSFCSHVGIALERCRIAAADTQNAPERAECISCRSKAENKQILYIALGSVSYILMAVRMRRTT